MPSQEYVFDPQLKRVVSQDKVDKQKDWLTATTEGLSRAGADALDAAGQSINLAPAAHRRHESTPEVHADDEVEEDDYAPLFPATTQALDEAVVAAGDRVAAGVKGHVEMGVDVVHPPPRPLTDPLTVRCDLSAPAAGSSAPLAGLSFVAKDNLDVAGLPTGNGSPDWAAGARGGTAAAHAPAVSAVLDAGARLLGKIFDTRASVRLPAL